MEAPWTHTPDEVLDYYRVDVGRGLSEKQIVEHALKYGKNGEYCFLSVFFPFLCVEPFFRVDRL